MLGLNLHTGVDEEARIQITYQTRNNRKNFKTYEESDYVLIRIESCVLWNKHGHPTKLLWTLPIALEQSDDRTTVLSDTALLGAA
ncbi:S2-RNase [Pyrus ussuriensis x Pyrus communis]|uniref:S2-RNase n=1 Tax=Pyrus ussuriensis x Pyrus communis TaxID=2448454 RepID=A0A5N5HHT2_9ROSA|nr:S2-RNase [Pyrus ussuriensis x Pyrus communis]